ncbi:uncharacterized protein MYCFIDRAFT_204748 [Pseudocercospora fijiensis CIRAD86]|uniref:Uncharacterized protein n=1 Tax=Pseudocercospora fijiensis (strain CIRAD86) TaxID=383855 RepID=M2YNH7_PSEFD|nr:uncharacterized protein MYCFIDRAFT_204748 [Pseudocercospora fijiensis CIRAD86]EME79245.1 hypothetical protein MYCFIDRAFT_204748 [Pseudocercospora fijiensis CIRAD86]
MAHRIDDKWLWFAFGIFAFFAAKGVQNAMQDVVRLTELDADQYPSEKEDAGHPEHSIPLHTLRTLIKHPNRSIASSAEHIVIKRFASWPGASDILRNDLLSGDEDIRRQARQAVRFLQEWGLDLADGYGNLPFDRARNQMPMMDRSEWDMLAEESPDEEMLDSGVVARLEELEALNEISHDDLARQARFAGWDNFPHPRPSNTGSAEAERRRRRREAMVLHEGSGGIVEGDIIRPRGR